MALFSVPTRNIGREQDTKLAKKVNSKAKKATTSVKGGGGIMGRISTINTMVDKYLGKYKDESITINTQEVLHSYIDTCIANEIVAIDTETTGLDPMLDSIAGVCLYTPNQKTAYVPINHISYITHLPIPEQLDVAIVKDELQRIVDARTKVLMFNAPFDIRVLRNQVGVYMECWWDCYPAARLLNENEGEGNNGLKKLHQKYVLNGTEDAFKFDDLFKGIPFTQIPIKTGYLYAAHDAKITYELYKFQEQYLDPNMPLCKEKGLEDVAKVFRDIEMPIVDVVANMEDRGIAFDMEYNKKLSVIYNEKLQETINNFYVICDDFADRIEDYKLSHIDHKLDTPINIASNQQIAILLYDILGIDVVDKKNPRGTGVEILGKIDHPIAKAILAYREMAKLISTYIDKMPDCVNPNDGRVHCEFNQVGADTGRMSSRNPNMQNLPSHNKDIRKSFIAQEGYYLMSADFSQQEPKTLAALCRRDGDSQMYDTFMQGKDLYAEIASKAFNYPYEDCLEFYLDENGNKTDKTNKEGKARRTQAKSVLLGALYGRGVNSIAEQLKVTTEKAKEIKNSVFKGFPAIKKFEDDSLKMARELGYVTTVCGRKRRLPDLQLDEYEFHWKDGCAPSEDLLDFDSDDVAIPVPEGKQRYYLQQLRACKFWDKPKIFDKAKEEGIRIVDNGGKIADATRQCVNSRVQGGAADLTKLAMIEVDNDERLKELGFQLLIPIHDELLCECPIENVKECSQLLAELMSRAAEKVLGMPIKTDVAISKEWYGEEIEIS